MRRLQRWLIDGDEEPRFDWRVVVVLVTAAVMLTLRHDQYRFPYERFVKIVSSLETSLPVLNGLTETLTANENARLARLVYWSLWQTIPYVLIPVLVIKLVFRERLRDYGLKVRGMLRFWWVYLALYLSILPAVLVASTTDSFQFTYPFYKLAPGEPLWPRFVIWQLFYAWQFVSLEFFFRGFMIHGTRRKLGVYSVFVMTIPYCMIHFGKPLPETLGAIVAGVVLGFLSLRTRSIWLGALSHISVALTMDFAALAQRT